MINWKKKGLNSLQSWSLGISTNTVSRLIINQCLTLIGPKWSKHSKLWCKSYLTSFLGFRSCLRSETTIATTMTKHHPQTSQTLIITNYSKCSSRKYPQIKPSITTHQFKRVGCKVATTRTSWQTTWCWSRLMASTLSPLIQCSRSTEQIWCLHGLTIY